MIRRECEESPANAGNPGDPGRDIFGLYTDRTAYVFRVTGTGHLEHLYYGAADAERIHALCKSSAGSPIRHHGNAISYSSRYPKVYLEDLCLEMSSYGKGDIREPFVELIFPDGSRTCDFLFQKAEILREKDSRSALPGSYGLPANEHLCVTLREAEYEVFLELHYYVYAETDVICRSSRLINRSGADIRIERLMSAMFDLPGSGYVMTTFTGGWADEMHRNDTQVHAGTYSVSSVCGFTSDRANPFFMVSRPETGEESGECYGFNLIYSGNHLEVLQAHPQGNTRIVNGINPAGFSWKLGDGESFEAPEAILCFSGQGFLGIRDRMQSFIREHIIRGTWKDRVRPVLLNSWEAFYFDFDEERILKLAEDAKALGIELFVLDDGWFGGRRNDRSSLGDWQVNRERFPGGLAGLADKLNAMGLAFGIWVEPEMICTDSDLYRAHPDWAMAIPGRDHSEGRNQRILDLINPEVRTWLRETLTELFSSANISYVKWDCNRLFSDAYSPSLPADRQGETMHRYMLALYELLGEITGHFPDILFEGCAAGGGRFDPGMLCFFPQIWGSDNTDPVCRERMHKSYSYGYPMTCIGAHVSASPNHQTGRETPLRQRYEAAAAGQFGYELNLLVLSPDEHEEIRAQIEDYKRNRRQGK